MTYPDEEEVYKPVIHLSGLEHPLRTNGPPNQGRIVHDFGAVACEALLVLWLAQIGDVSHHPS
jgi:hypothetical protein